MTEESCMLFHITGFSKDEISPVAVHYFTQHEAYIYIYLFIYFVQTSVKVTLVLA